MTQKVRMRMIARRRRVRDGGETQSKGSREREGRNTE